MSAALQLPQIRVGAGSEGGHWYVPTSPPQCAYEILGANGAWRACNMKDAKKYGWYPGVTTIAGQEKAPALENWKVKQGILSALTHPKATEIADYDLLIDTILKDSKEQAKKAAEAGTRIHKAIEVYFETGCVENVYKPYVESVCAVLHQLTGVDERALWQTETTACHPFGFGTRVDLFSKSLGVVVDFKGKEFGPDDRVSGWPEQARQLAACREMVLPGARCINLYVSRNHPGLVKPYEWDESDLVKAWDEFRALLHFWQVRNSFPRLVRM